VGELFLNGTEKRQFNLELLKGFMNNGFVYTNKKIDGQLEPVEIMESGVLSLYYLKATERAFVEKGNDFYELGHGRVSKVVNGQEFESQNYDFVGKLTVLTNDCGNHEIRKNFSINVIAKIVRNYNSCRKPNSLGTSNPSRQKLRTHVTPVLFVGYGFYDIKVKGRADNQLGVAFPAFEDPVGKSSLLFEVALYIDFPRLNDNLLYGLEFSFNSKGASEEVHFENSFTSEDYTIDFDLKYFEIKPFVGYQRELRHITTSIRIGGIFGKLINFEDAYFQKPIFVDLPIFLQDHFILVMGLNRNWIFYGIRSKIPVYQCH